MTRVSTAGNYQSALLNLMTAQTRQQEASQRISTQKVATDLTGFGRGAESLTSLKGAQSRVKGFIETGEVVAARLQSQDLALGQIGDALGEARAVIANTLASESASVLMLELQGQFQMLQNGMNARHQGAYLFSGADTTSESVKVETLAELAAAPNIDATLNDDGIRPKSRLAEATSVETGYLASDFEFTEPANGTSSHIFQIFLDIQNYHTGPQGPLTGKINTDQKVFLTAQLQRLDNARLGVLETTARNGSLQNRVETLTKSHEAQIAALDEMVSKKTDADLARAVTDLQLSQVAVQASAQVISQLSQVSLLNYLR